MSEESARSVRVEVAARALYRHWMAEDYDEFPWDDEKQPSNETVEEAVELANLVVRALDENYRTDDERFRRAVDEAARRRLQNLVYALDSPSSQGGTA